MRAVLCILVLGGSMPLAKAQEAVSDTALQAVTLDELIVTADRSSTFRTEATAGVSVLNSAEFSTMAGITGLADVLRLTPGFALLHLDGLGYDPQPVVRGFYGGGEAEYVVVMVNGQPINVLESGLVNWNQIPLAAVESVEILRGGASSLYGDAAIGGVINVVTADDQEPQTNLALAGGTFGMWRAEAALRRVWVNRSFGLFGNLDHTAGYRDHARRIAASGGLSADLVRGNRTALTVSGHGHWRSYEIPGPLTLEQISESRTQESVFFRLDGNDERTWRLAIKGRFELNPEVVITSFLGRAVRNLESTRTLPLSAEFADAKRRNLTTSRMLANGQIVSSLLRSIVLDRITVGADAHLGTMNNSWQEVVTGSAQVFAGHPEGLLGGISASGEARRQAVAAYAQYDLMPAGRLRLSFGGRYDRISDQHFPDGTDERTATHIAFSPRAGLNVRYARSTAHVGNWYANVSRSFKAPTLDQLYDQREIPVPFPPFGVTISNGELRPQRGVSLETGLYHRAVIAQNSLAAELSLSVYQMDMTDELDFQFETFQYENIAESRHRGIEFGAKLYVEQEAALIINYTLQNVTYQSGANQGKYVKAIPRTYVSLGARTTLAENLTVTGTLRSARRIWLDDANTLPLDNWATTDLKLTYDFGRATFMFESLNLLDEDYSTTGFRDPAGSDTVFLYPAAGRSIRAGIHLNW